MTNPDPARTLHFIGDVHYGASYPAASRAGTLLTDLQANPVPVLRRVQMGDVTENAKASEDTDALQFLSDVDADDIAIGNHDLTDYSTASFNTRTPAQFAAAYPDYCDGQHFTRDLGFAQLLFISPDEDAVPHLFSQATLDWLEDALAAATKDCIIVCHYPLYNTVAEVDGGEEQFRTDAGMTGSVSSLSNATIGRDRDIRDVLNNSQRAKVWVSGHTHSSLDARDIVKLHPLGDYTLNACQRFTNLLNLPTFTEAVTRAATNLLTANQADLESAATTGWSKTTTATENAFEASNVWAENGTYSLHYKATGSGSNQTAQVFTLTRFTATPGSYHGFVIPLNIVSQGAVQQAARIDWYNSTPTLISQSQVHPVGGTGEKTLVFAEEAPAGAATGQLLIGNYSFGTRYLQNTEVSEFYADYMHVALPSSEPSDDTQRSDFEGFAIVGWTTTVSNATLNAFELSGTWVNSGAASLHFKATATGANASAAVLVNPRIDVTEGTTYAFACPINLVSLGAKGPRLWVEWFDASAASLGTAASTTLEATGEDVLTLTARAPADTVTARVYVGNSTLNARELANTEVLEFYIDDVQFVEPTLGPPGRKIITVNASATAYTGVTSSDDDPIRSAFLTYGDGSLTVQWRDHGTEAWLDELTATVDIPDFTRAPAVREKPPLRLSVNIETPSGRHYRWGADEPDAANNPSGISFSTVAPGGFEQASLTLPRKPRVSYGDLERLSTLKLTGAGGQSAGEYRLESTPRVSGDQMAVSPGAVGWQAHLDDDKSASALYVDRAMGNWIAMSRERKVTLYTTGLVDVLQDHGVEPDEITGVPAIVLTANGRWATDLQAEAWYDAGPASEVESVYFDYVGRNLDANYTGRLSSFTDDTGSGAITGTDVVTGAASTGTLTETPSSAQRFVAFTLSGPGAPSTTDEDRDLRLRRVAVWGNHGLTKQGTAPDDGLYASDVITHAVQSFAPLLNLGDIASTGVVIPHLEFRESTTCSEIVSGANRFHLWDWMVWEDRTFHYHERGGRGKNWRARVGPARLEETGPQTERLWNGVIVRYNDVDGTTKTVGPEGSGANTETSEVEDTDPLNPANLLGIRRWDILDMGIVSTPAAATIVGSRFLEQAALLNTSGQATLVGHVEDDRGVAHPAWRVRAGDTITFVDAADTSPRRIIRTSYEHSSRTCSVDLDSPPEGLQALLERLQVVLVPLGL